MKSARKSAGHSLLDAVADNPFESRGIVNKKHDVFNRRVKGERRNVARARGQATQRREKTLLVDYERSQKANSFRDKRFGENDATLQLEEKLWARMQKDRSQRSRKGGIFNLGNDGDGPTELLTHRGQALGSNDEDGGYMDDEEDGLDAEVVDRLHFGGDGSQDARRDHSQVHLQLVFKLPDEGRQEDIKMCWESMGELLNMLNQRPAKRDGTPARGQSDDYDLAMRELVYEARAQATDRLQTPEETARSEKARLEKLEKARIERMSSQPGEGGAGAASVEGAWRRRKGRNDDELSGEGVSTSVMGIIEEEEDASENDDAGISGSNSDGSDEDKMGWTSESEAESEEGKWDSLVLARAKKKATRDHATRELPYVIACPSSYEDLLAVLAELATSADEINTILDRIHKNHSIKLDSRNKEKMHNFYDVLLKRFRRVGSQTGKPSSAEQQDREEQLNFLSRLIFDITAEMPEVAASLWHRFCGCLHQRMVKALADLNLGVASTGYWPSTGSLLLLKLAVQIFPSTDFRHPVVTPVVLHLSQCLSQCPVNTCGDLSAGLFCCSLMLHCCLGADRFSPEAMVFLSSALDQFGLRLTTQAAPSPAFNDTSLVWLRAAAGSYAREKLPSLSLGVGEVSTDAERSAFAAGSLGGLYHLLLQAARAAEGEVAFPELFGPLQRVLSEVQPKASPPLPRAIHSLHVQLSQQLSTASQKCISTRTPLQWRAVEVRTLDALAPKFQESYKMKKDGHEVMNSFQVGLQILPHPLGCFAVCWPPASL
ncbi:unnamed protein product [Scytosiphon promiscuus]